MSEDLFKKPVHGILVKPTHLQKLEEEGKIPKSLKKFKLPQEEQPKKEKRKLVNFENVYKNKPTQIKKQANLKARLKVLHGNPEIYPQGDEIPPCDTCKAAPCCKAFIVTITEEEYESGWYDDLAFKFTPEMIQQLGPNKLLLAQAGGVSVDTDENIYALEGMIGQPCPFLDDNNRCSIYSKRPLTCRAYTCVGDDRITEGMREGTEPVC